jgi:hypothetical protein
MAMKEVLKGELLMIVRVATHGVSEGFILVSRLQY